MRNLPTLHSDPSLPFDSRDSVRFPPTPLVPRRSNYSLSIARVPALFPFLSPPPPPGVCFGVWGFVLEVYFFNIRSDRQQQDQRVFSFFSPSLPLLLYVQLTEQAAPPSLSPDPEDVPLFTSFACFSPIVNIPPFLFLRV